MDAVPAPEKDVPLREDIRLLGRVLGDTVREQEGSETYELIERIRQLCVRFRRDDDLQARRELETTLDGLSIEQSLNVVRAFSFFSLLANIAEDQHHIRRSRAHSAAGSAPRKGSLAHAIAAVEAAGHSRGELPGFFEQARAAFSIGRLKSLGCWPRGIAEERFPRNVPPTTRNCAAPCWPCGKPACCDVCGSR